jgi:hypothetical protein
MADVDVQTLRNIYYEKFAALVNDLNSFRAWWAQVVCEDGDFIDNHSLMNWYINCSDIASHYDINDYQVRCCVGFALQDNDLPGEFTDHLWEHDVYFDRPLPRHISDDDEIYASDDEDTDPTAQVAPEAEISDDPSSPDDDLAEEDDYDEVAERNYSDYIEMIQRNRWQGDE